MTRILLILVLMSVLAWAFWRFVVPPKQRRQRAAPMKLVRDPVPPGESFAFNSGGETHYFCSVECRERFRKSA